MSKLINNLLRENRKLKEEIKILQKEISSLKDENIALKNDIDNLNMKWRNGFKTEDTFKPRFNDIDQKSIGFRD